MPYTDLRFKAGINKEITPYSEENGWVDCDKVLGLDIQRSLTGGKRTQVTLFLGCAVACMSGSLLMVKNF